MTERPVRDSFLVFGQPEILQPEIDEVVDSLRTAWLGTGPKVARFKADFARYKGVEHVTAVNSCTAALHLSCVAAGLAPGDEVITTALTFCATVNAVLHSGATPIVVDCDPVTMNLSPAAVEAAITPRTRALIPVHFAGRLCDMGALTDIARRHDLVLIEDCAHAVEAQDASGQGAGTFGDFATFSFYATKNVVTGEGGMIIARRAEDSVRLEQLALHGMSADAWRRFGDAGFKHYTVTECGYKYNMMDLQAALGIHQLSRVEANWKRREQVSERYAVELADLPITLPAPPEPGTRHAHHLYPILLDPAAGVARDDFLDRMTAERIGVGVHYLALPEHPYYQGALGWRPEDTPEATRIGRTTVSLPLAPRLSDDDVSDVVAAVRRSLVP